MLLKQLIVIGAAVLLLGGGVAFAQPREGNQPARPDRRPWNRGPDLPVEIMDEIRTEADKNKDGELDRDERRAMWEMIRLKAEEREVQMLAKFDADGDGELSRAERETAREAERKAAEEKRAKDYEALFGELDANGDGNISKEEWLAGRDKATEELGQDHAQAQEQAREREMEQRRAEFVKQFDKDGDGQLNEAEQRAARQQMQDRMRAQRQPQEQRDGPPIPPNADGDVEL